MHVSSPPRPLRASRAGHPARGRLLVAAIEAIVGAGAVFGGYGLLSDAEGLGAKQEWLDGSVFADYTVPGVVLLAVIGGGLLAAAAITLLRERHAASAAGVMTAALLAWGLTESVTIGWRGWHQLVLVGTFVVAPALVLGRFALRGRRGR